ncbi:hypothetical protein AK830_g10168 [Neonectria ditissima]|uniref:Uncharacterized protein n=1 Tax=Neonectria ditissima TaxID=78410 RepID=A0A0P7AG98_9HYPO|nr:hypothetical protein AK830_g10168 [Neonectria ditissima]
MEVEASGQNSINLLETWRNRASLGCHEDTPLPALDSDLSKVPRCPASDPLLEELLKEMPFKPSRHGTDLKKLLPKKSLLHTLSHLPRPSTGKTAFTFTASDDRTQPLFIQPKPSPSAFRGVKRRRNISDVDGFNTVDMSSKKRRLRIDLITSRLSQPYSQPATHILNREGQDSGDKRFLKMATTLDSSRRAVYLHATSFLRYATMNCLRKRLSQVHHHPGSFVRRDDQEAAAMVASKSSLKVAWRPQSLEASSAGKSLRVSADPIDGVYASPVVLSPSPSPSPPMSSRSQPASPKHILPHGKPPACRLSSPAALPLPVTDLAATKKRTSPRIYPVQSPELRPSSSLSQLDDLEEDSFAFLHPADDDWDDLGDDNQDGVYSDFNVMFGQDSTDGETKDERTYEEYLDELDGICWVSR